MITLSKETSSTSASKAADVLAELGRVDLDHAEICLFVVASSQRKEGWYKRRLSLTKGVAEQFRDVVKKLRSDLQGGKDKRNLIFVDFELDRKPDGHEVEVLDLSKAEFATIREHFSNLDGSNAVPDLTRDEAKVHARRFRYYVVRISLGDGRYAYFIRHYTKSRTLVPTKGFAYVYEQDGLRELEHTVLTFDDTIHGVAVGDTLLIRDKAALFNALSFFQVMETIARDALDAIKSTIKIENVEAIEAMIGKHHGMRQKLARIGQSPYISSLTFDHIRRTLAAFPSLKIEVLTDSKGDEYLSWEESTEWEVVKLLGDDLLASFMTDLRYEVNSKSLRT